MDNNLDLQYALDADIETAFDSFVDAIYDEVMNDEMKTTIISLPKHQQMKFVYSVLKHFAKGTDAGLSSGKKQDSADIYLSWYHNTNRIRGRTIWNTKVVLTRCMV